MAGARLEDLKILLGEKEVERAASFNVLVVGAGGIGCELLKNLAMSGFRKISIVDLDTIDLSNLNRQFLFQKQHIKQPKAVVARESVLKFNPDIEITAYHDSIFSKKFNLNWFKGFDLCMNALDNIAARRHVNQMCVASRLPLIESGTAGYLGQATIHMDGTTCYDCTAKPIEKKSYPVCTIRSTPSAPVHCIVWAKSYLFNALFGRLDDEEELNMSTENADKDELLNLKREADQLKDMRNTVGTPTAAPKIFEKIFKTDIERLLSMEDLWKSRKPPVPLNYSDYKTASKSKLRLDALQFDQKPWSLEENYTIFCEMLTKLGKRIIQLRDTHPDATLEWDKDDEDALNFVTATANLRASIFNIEMKSRFEVKEIAGNIIPAIATTNAIAAGMVVMLAFKVISKQVNKCQNSYISYGGDRTRFLLNEELPKPNPNCAICTTNYFEIRIGKETKLNEIIQETKSKLRLDGEITVQSGENLLYDVEFEDNLAATAEELEILDGSLTITNDSDDPSTDFCVVLFVTKSKKSSGCDILIEVGYKLKSRPKTIQSSIASEKESSEPSNKKMKMDIIEDELEPIMLE